MKKQINFLTIILLMAVFFLFLIYQQAKTEAKKLRQENLNLRQKTSCPQIPSISLKEALLLGQKEKKLAEVKKTNLYFTAQKTKINPSQWQVIFLLQGDTQAAADAADLWVDFSKNIQIVQIKSGIAFPLYPRKVVDQNHLLITGLAQIKDNQIIYGQPGKVFAEIRVNVLTNNNVRPFLKLNINDTKIFLNGESIFDSQKSFSEITLF